MTHDQWSVFGLLLILFFLELLLNQKVRAWLQNWLGDLSQAIIKEDKK